MHSDIQRLIQKVEELSGRPVHVTEDPELKVMAAITTARNNAPAHFLRYRPGTQAVDYLIAYQLGFLIRLFACPEGERWEVVATSDEQQVGLEALGLTDFPLDFGRTMVGNVVTQIRSYSVGARVDGWIRKNMPELWPQQDHSIRSQLAENTKALAPEIREKFPKLLIDANTTMNAAYALAWGDVLKEPRFSIPFKALGYEARATELLEILNEIPDDPQSDRALVESWAKYLGLKRAFHFEPHILT